MTRRTIDRIFTFTVLAAAWLTGYGVAWAMVGAW